MYLKYKFNAHIWYIFMYTEVEKEFIKSSDKFLNILKYSKES